VPTDISLSQFLAIQEKGVSAWEFEAELEIANCFVEARTEVEFFDSECSVQSNLPVPKQNEVYYWEAKIYDKPENTLVSIGMTTKPYPMFRLPGKSSGGGWIGGWGIDGIQVGINTPSPTPPPATAAITSPSPAPPTDPPTIRAT
jgi:hypothetical protein